MRSQFASDQLFEDDTSSDECASKLTDSIWVDTITSSEVERNTYHVTNLAMMADRCGVGSATAAMLVNAYLEDLGIADSTNIVDKQKQQRAPQRVRHH